MKADLHVHSLHSPDGKSSVEEILRAAEEFGLGCIAITDHNSFKAFFECKDNGRIIVIPGEEVSSSEGHIIALGIDREIPRNLNIIDTINAIHEAGGIAIAAHPYRWWSGLGEKNVVKEFDGIEALNGRSTKGSNKKSLALAKASGKPMTAGSDSHVPATVGEGYVDLPDDCKTWQDALDAIKACKAVPHSKDRTTVTTLKYGWKSITQWMGRGFKRM